MLPPARQASTAAPVWRFFREIAAIPRASGHEGPVRGWLAQYGFAAGWDVREDDAGNLVLGVPGRGRLADASVLILQAHMDMVCEKLPASTHDFTTDPIVPQVDGDWIHAEGTTLGADNGIGLALALAAATAGGENRLPLELLCTADEETGLSGAMGLAPGLLRGRRLLNLDGEADDVLIIGCAGGADVHVTFPPAGVLPAGAPAAALHLTGFRGGHSGVDIADGRLNAIRCLAELICRLADRHPRLQLAAIDGGNKKNAIPRDCSCILSGVTAAAAQALAEPCLAAWREHEPGATLTASVANAPATGALPPGLARFLVDVVNGVIAMDPVLPEQVRTSSSLGVIETGPQGAAALIHTRSAADDERDTVAAGICATAAELGGVAAVGGRYPGWSPKPSGALLNAFAAIYRDSVGEQPRIEAIHAGLEAGIIGDRIGTDDLLAFGPTIENAHSPGERLSRRSTEKVWRLLAAFVSTPENRG